MIYAKKIPIEKFDFEKALNIFFEGIKFEFKVDHVKDPKSSHADII